MSKNMQNLIFLMEPNEHEHEISFKGGNMCMNKFCIDEDATFESSGVYFLRKSSWLVFNEEQFEVESEFKGNGY